MMAMTELAGKRYYFKSIYAPLAAGLSNESPWSLNICSEAHKS